MIKSEKLFTEPAWNEQFLGLDHEPTRRRPACRDGARGGRALDAKRTNESGAATNHRGRGTR